RTSSPLRQPPFPYTTLFRSWQEDIGRVTEMLHHTDDSPAVLFDDIPGYPSGFRILANANATRTRLALTLGLPIDIERRPLMDRRSEEHTSELESPYDLVCRL